MWFTSKGASMRDSRSTASRFAGISLLVVCASIAWATPPTPLTSLDAIHRLSNTEASRALPVAFEATVTYFRGFERTLFVQDHDSAIFVLNIAT
jgi:hypothetical protein